MTDIWKRRHFQCTWSKFFFCAISSTGSVLKCKFKILEASMCFSSLNYPENNQQSIGREWWISRAAFSLSLTARPLARVSRDCRWVTPAPNKVCTVKSCTNAHSYQSFNAIKKILVSSCSSAKHTQPCFAMKKFPVAEILDAIMILRWI